MRRLLAVAVTLALAGQFALAQDSPSGTWKWSVTRGGNTVETTLKLTLEGDKLSGAILGRNNQETKIEEATYKNGEISFKVTRERGGQKFVTKYSGKLSGDTIKGKIETDRGGQTQSTDWEAKRSK